MGLLNDHGHRIRLDDHGNGRDGAYRAAKEHSTVGGTGLDKGLVVGCPQGYLDSKCVGLSTPRDRWLCEPGAGHDLP